MRFMLGVDEAGRGPVAGPVSVGAVMAAEGFDIAKEFPGVADSKQLSEKKREAIFTMLEQRASRGDVQFAVELESAQAIDHEGIVPSVRAALYRAVNTLAPDAAEVFIQLDGSLKAPPEYAQETIIRGDATVPIISLASIAAKVTRDRLMHEFAEKYPEYGFEKHKGYGTAFHYQMIDLHGPCVMHRRSFLGL